MYSNYECRALQCKITHTVRAPSCVCVAIYNNTNTNNISNNIFQDLDPSMQVMVYDISILTKIICTSHKTLFSGRNISTWVQIFKLWYKYLNLVGIFEPGWELKKKN